MRDAWQRGGDIGVVWGRRATLCGRRGGDLGAALATWERCGGSVGAAQAVRRLGGGGGQRGGSKGAAYCVHQRGDCVGAAWLQRDSVRAALGLCGRCVGAEYNDVGATWARGGGVVAVWEQRVGHCKMHMGGVQLRGGSVEAT